MVFQVSYFAWLCKERGWFFSLFLSFFLVFVTIPALVCQYQGEVWLQCFCWQTSAGVEDIARQLLSFEGCQHFHVEDFHVLDKAFWKILVKTNEFEIVWLKFLPQLCLTSSAKHSLKMLRDAWIGLCWKISYSTEWTGLRWMMGHIASSK